MKYQIKTLDELKWIPHPFLKGVEFKYLLTKAEDHLDLTFSFVRVAPEQILRPMCTKLKTISTKLLQVP